MNDNDTQAMICKPTIGQRIERWLFPYRHPDDSAAKFSGGWVRVDVVTQFSWADILRLIVSRRLLVRGYVHTEKPCGDADTYAAATVLSPWGTP